MHPANSGRSARPPCAANPGRLLRGLLERRAHDRLRGLTVRGREGLDQVVLTADEDPAQVGELAEALDAVMATRAALPNAAEGQRRQGAVDGCRVHARPA